MKHIPLTLQTINQGFMAHLIASDTSYDKMSEAVCMGGRIRPPMASQGLGLSHTGS